MPLELRIELFPRDLEAFVDFYVRVLGFVLVQDRRGHANPYVSVRRDSVRIGALPAWVPVDAATRSVPAGAELVLESDDVEAERDAVVSAGWSLDADLKVQAWGLTDFRILDPDGYYIRITGRRTSSDGSHNRH